MRVKVLIALTVLCVSALSGCSSGGGLPPLPATSPTESSYQLGSGDKLHVNVFGAEDLTGDFTVSDTGTLSFPLIGDVKAVGLTPEQLSKALHDRLADGFMRDPKVSVQVNTYRPFYIFGEVTRPGEYPYSAGMSVLNAVALGGGYSYRANQNYVVVRRDNRDYSATGLSHILAGDIIRVPERYF
jgi:protein involved in polysaccharide export with SLBB domain